MFCKRCDGAYHCYCLQPPHKVKSVSLTSELNMDLILTISDMIYDYVYCRMSVLGPICAQNTQGVTVAIPMSLEMD